MEIYFCHSLWTVAPTNFISLCVCLYVCLSRFYGLYFMYYRLDFDQTWWKCWNLGPINSIKMTEKPV